MKKILPVIIAVVVVGCSAFYGGMKYGQSNVLTGSGQGAIAGFANLTPEQRQQRLQQMGAGAAGAQFGSRGNGGDANGEIIAKDDKSITLKLRDGGSKIIFYSANTEIGKFASGIASDLEIGKTVSINGKTNSDGSISAQSIQIRPVPANPAQSQ